MKEEVIHLAKKLYPYNDGFQIMDIDISEELQTAFINGTKWKQQINYSEVFEWLASKDYLSDKVETIQKEFEDFKNK